MVVVDGATPELADAAATTARQRRCRQSPNFSKAVRRPDGGAFFDRNGLLLLSLDEVAATTKGLMRARPLLASLAADPSLRGVLAAISNMPGRDQARTGDAP